MLRVHEVSGSIPETDRYAALCPGALAGEDCLVGPMDKATAYGAVDSGFESQAGLTDGHTKGRIPCPVRSTKSSPFRPG